MHQSRDISVVMTTFNRAQLLDETLDSLAAMDTRALDWELIVVDNDSSDDTPAILQRYRDRLPMTLCHEPRRGYAKAKNHGLGKAGGKLIVFTDDDVIVDAQWLQSLLAASRRWPDVGIFGGRIRPILPDDLPHWLQSASMRERTIRMFGDYNPEPSEGTTDHPPVGANLAVRALAMGDLRLDENRGANGSDNYLQSAEIDFIRRLIASGERVVFVPTASVDHIIRIEQLALAKLLARTFRRGRNDAARNLARYRTRMPIAGAPIGLWLTIAKLQLRLWSYWPLGKQVRYPVQDKLAFKRGALYQLREQQRQPTHPDWRDPAS